MKTNEQLVMEFDIRGQVCPSSLLLALKEMNRHKERLKIGAVKLAFTTDSRDATVTIPDAAANMGYGAHVAKQEGHYLIVVDNGQ
jgi:TusA-related sulfurtransferase